MVKDVTIQNDFGGSIFVENSSEFNNVKTTLFGGSIDFDYPTGIKTESEELEVFTLSNYSNLYIEYGTLQGSYQYPVPNIINIRDGSVLSIGEEAIFNRINLNITDWGVFNFSNNCVFSESAINVSNSGRLIFPEGNTFTPATIINSGLGGQIIVEESSTLNLNSGVLNIQAGASVTLSKGTSLRPAAGYTLTYPRSASLNLGDESKLYGIMDFLPGSSCKTGSQSTVHIMPGADIEMTETNLVLNYGCDLIVEAGAKLSLVGPMRVIMCPGSEIIVYGEFSATPDVIYTTNVDESDPDRIDLEPWSGIVANVGSVINISEATFENATIPISGTPDSLIIKNCTFTDCQNGINIVNCNNFTIENNTFTGVNTGVGISLTQSEGALTGNTISNFSHGIDLTTCSPLLTKNIIKNNVNYGLCALGWNTNPQLIDPTTTKSYLNNDIKGNGIAQIYLKYSASAYMTGGNNNVYTGVAGIIPDIPCIMGVSNTATTVKAALPSRVVIDAERNYWGAQDSTQIIRNFNSFFDLWTTSTFNGYRINYLPIANIPYTYENQLPVNQLSSNLPPDPSSILLSNAIKQELAGNLQSSIKIYENVIKRDSTSAEALVASARLPIVYLESGLAEDPLIQLYDSAIASEDFTNKKFYKEMKVSTYLKNRKYDEAILIAEGMKIEAETEGEVLLAEIDIAIANMMKNSGNKGASSSEILNKLIAKLSGNEDKGELDSPADITESVLPTVSTLYQNYPNPFNPVTQIKFDLAKSAKVRLSVYNVNGQFVAELANGVMNAGNHTVDFDGNKLNSGIYYYTLEVDNNCFTKKMLIIK